jgi:hypothetical protein
VEQSDSPAKAIEQFLWNDASSLIGADNGKLGSANQLANRYCHGRLDREHSQQENRALRSIDFAVEPWIKRDVIHIDLLPSDIDKDYKPAIELTGSISATVEALTDQVTPRARGKETVFLDEIAQQRTEFVSYAMRMHLLWLA